MAIWDQIAQHNPQAAERVVMAIEDTIELLVDFPRPESFPHGPSRLLASLAGQPLQVGVEVRHMSPLTPTRCVQRLRLAVEQGERSAIASLSRGRIALPPRAHRMHAFDAGGGASQRRGYRVLYGRRAITPKSFA